MTTIGNEESRHYVLSGPAVDDANKAEKFSLPGTFVLSPKAWAYTPDHETYDYEVLSDEKHVSVSKPLGAPLFPDHRKERD